jgi:hypothetical protein
MLFLKVCALRMKPLKFAVDLTQSDHASGVGRRAALSAAAEAIGDVVCVVGVGRFNLRACEVEVRRGRDRGLVVELGGGIEGGLQGGSVWVVACLAGPGKILSLTFP